MRIDAYEDIIKKDFETEKGLVHRISLAVSMSYSEDVILHFKMIRFVDYPEYPVLLSSTIIETEDQKYIFYKINYNLDFFYMDFIDSETKEVETIKMFY